MSEKIKLVLFDAYGVCLNEGYPNTSRWLAKKYKKNWRNIQKILYAKYFNLAAEKRISQAQAWQLALDELKIPLSVSQVKKIHFRLMRTNPQMLTEAQRLKKRLAIAVLSKNTREQFREVKARFPQLKKVFGRSLINTWEYGLPKASEKTIAFVCKKFRVKPEEIVYIDDQAANLAAPETLGVKTILYKNFPLFRKELGRYLD